MKLRINRTVLLRSSLIGGAVAICAFFLGVLGRAVLDEIPPLDVLTEFSANPVRLTLVLIGYFVAYTILALAFYWSGLIPWPGERPRSPKP